MLGNAIKQTTTTTGTGNLALASVSGYPTFANQFALNQPFAYALLDSSGLFLETGMGYLSNSTTLVRARVTATYASSTYTNVSPSAVSLSGTTTVICSPHASSAESMLPTVDAVSSGINRFLTSAARIVTGSAQSVASSRVHYVPFLLRSHLVLNSLGINVAGAGSAGTVSRVGVYAMTANGYPGDRLATVADLATDSTGLKTASLSTALFLPPGWYFTAATFTGTPSITGYNSASGSMLGGGPFGHSTISAIEYRYETGSTLPSTASTTTTASTVGTYHPPMVFLGAA